LRSIALKFHCDDDRQNVAMFSLVQSTGLYIAGTDKRHCTTNRLITPTKETSVDKQWN